MASVTIHNTSTWHGVLLGQLKLSLLHFFTGRDFGEFYGFANAPMLAVVLGPFVALGLTLMLLRITDSRYAMLALWFWSVVLLGGVLTINSPQSHRLLPAALPALAGVALVLHWLIDAGPRLVHSHLAPVFLVATIALPIFADTAITPNTIKRLSNRCPGIKVLFKEDTLHRWDLDTGPTLWARLI